MAAQKPVKAPPLREAAVNRAKMTLYVRQGDISQAAVDHAFTLLPEELLANDDVMSVLFYFCAGIDALAKKYGMPVEEYLIHESTWTRFKPAGAAHV